jgi:DNA-binding CsgD family transcriptional regulator
LVLSDKYDYFIGQSGKIYDIAKPLEKLKVFHFSFLQKNRDGTYLYFDSNPTWQEDFFLQALHVSSEYLPQRHHQYEHYSLMTYDKPLKVLTHAKEKFDENYGLSIIRSVDRVARFFFFASRNDCPNMFDFYINHLYLFRRFASYFEEMIKDEVCKAQLYAFTLREMTLPYAPAMIQKEDIDSFMRETEFKPSQLLHPSLGNIHLSSREWECLRLTGKHWSCLEIAKHLNISTRTVETYVEQIKNKLGLMKKTEIIDVLHGIENIF